MLGSSIHGLRDTEAKWSHLVDLRTRLSAADVEVSQLAGLVEPDKVTIAKARRKVLDQPLEDRAKTDAMRETPRVRFERRARSGHWAQSPVDPARWYDKLAGRRAPSHGSAGRTFAASHQLGERLRRYDGPRRGVTHRLALYLAFQTVAVEFPECSDESYGNIGDLRFDAFETYVSIDWASTDLAAEHCWQDLCEMLVSLVYALTFEQETLPFPRADAGQAEMIETILVGLAAA